MFYSCCCYNKSSEWDIKNRMTLILKIYLLIGHIVRVISITGPLAKREM